MRNKKLPANLAGKSHCDTVESTKAKLSDAVFARWQRSAKPNNDTGSPRRQFLSGERKHGKNHAFAKACRAKRPSHLSHEANCLRLFLAHV